MKITIEDLKNKINSRDLDKGFQGSSYSFRSMNEVEEPEEKSDVETSPEKQHLELTISSEYPVRDWYGYLTLEHSEQALVTDRIKNGAAFRDEHNGDQVGIITDYMITPNKKLKVGVDVSPHNPRAIQLYKEYRDRLRKNTSCRFVVHELVLERTVADVDYYRAIKWELIHGAFVPDGADPNVGMDRSLKPINIINKSKESSKMEENKDRVLTDQELDNLKANLKKELQADQQAAVDRAFQNGGEKALINMAGIFEKARQFKNDIKGVDLEKEAVKYVVSGMTERQFGDVIVQKLSEQKPVESLDLSSKDRNQFSAAKLILSFSDSKVDASHEREICAHYAKERNLKSQGIVIPRELIFKDRTMTVASSTEGAKLVGTNLLASQFIPLARNKALIDQLGVVTLPNLVGDVAIPTQSAAITGGWMSDESTGSADSNATFGQKSLSPKTFMGTTSFSRKLLLQGTPQIDMLVEEDLQKICNLAKDKAVFHGAGTTQPTGIVPTSGVGLGTVKTSWTLADIVAMETVIASSNLDTATMAYVTTPTIRGTLKTTLKDSGVPGYIWENGEVNGYRAFASNQITAGFIFHGDFSQAIVGEWGGLDIVVDAVTSKAGLVYITAYLSMDVALRYAGAFSFYKPS